MRRHGHEVPRAYPFQRKRPFRPRLAGEPSRRRAEVLDGLLAGLSYGQLALRMNVSKSTINTHARRLYEQHRVKGPDALRRQLARREQVRAA